MKRHLKALTLLISTALTFGAQSAGAQEFSGTASSVTQTYNANDLVSRPGLVKMNKGDMVVFDFPAPIEAAVIQRAELLETPELLGNVMTITAVESSGSTNMLVKLNDGSYSLWDIKLGQGGQGIKRIAIQNLTAANYAQPVAQPISGPAVQSTAPAAYPAYVTPAYGLPQVTAQNTTQQALQNILARSAPATQQNALSSGVTPLLRQQPSWLNAQATISTSPAGQQAVNFIITNTGDREIRFEARDLTIASDSGVYNSAYDGSFSVPAGGTQTISLPMREVITAGTTKIAWTGYDAGTKTFYTVVAPIQ